ncbi:hypothetical protein DFR85_06620 [Acidianus brierleyi]|nr:hypothetical protein DFR85_06620 [Acidianus brierleyi]
MAMIKVIFGTYGDNNILPLLYEVVRSFKVKIGIDVETDLLYDYEYPTLEIDGKRVIFDYSSEEEAKEKLLRLIKGEIMEGKNTKKLLSQENYIFGNGATIY